MPARDDDDFESKRQQIIDGALEVFARKGFAQATNKDIAQAAGIGSPGLIYHYFKDKADLFEQMLAQRAPIFQVLSRGDDLMDRPPQEVLPLFGHAFIATLGTSPALAVFKVMIGEVVKRPEVAEVFNRAGPGRGLTFLRHYLARQIERGTLRPLDPDAAARCFVGPLLAYILTRELFPDPGAPPIPAETMAATAVEIFLHGMLSERTHPEV